MHTSQLINTLSPVMVTDDAYFIFILLNTLFV